MDGIVYSPKQDFVKIHHTIDRQDTPTEYKPLRFLPSGLDSASERQIAIEWLTYFRDPAKHPATFTKQSAKNIKIHTKWFDDQGKSQSSQTTLSRVIEVIRQHHYFAQEHVNITPGAKTPWPDRGIAATMDHYWPDNQNNIQGDTTIVSLDIGDGFPLKATIDREGFCYSPLMRVLYSSIINSRDYLVNNSNHLFEPEDMWIQNLFTYLNSSISLIESTLMQIYYKAKYDEKDNNGLGKESGLKFDEKKMGGTITGRALDKIHWLFLCTGRHIENIDNELCQIKLLKDVRNHINHFDPPIFACTAEDVANWLNVTKHIGSFIWKIRRLLRLPPSRDICSLLYLPQVEFTPRNPRHHRGTQKPVVGYASSKWPKQIRCSASKHLTAAQCRGARGMLAWSQEKLATTSLLPCSLIEGFEAATLALAPYQKEILTKTFKVAGIIFKNENDGESVMLASSPEDIG